MVWTNGSAIASSTIGNTAIEKIEPINITNTLASPETILSSNQLETSSDEQSHTSAGMEQVTSVTQLSDVRPTDWAFQALQSLVERYGCIAGYPDR
jgi:uncharacterized protein involved in exopolysaccharide biosynthesis